MRIQIKNLDLEQIANSGQCFRWKLLEKSEKVKYQIPALKKILEIQQCGDFFELSCDEKEWQDVWKSYFDMDTDYEKIGERILKSQDEYLKEAYKYGSGIRILRQDLWEIIISFLISQNNNITRIKKSVEAISDLNNGFFPQANEIDPKLFYKKELGLGYRSEYLELMYNYANKNVGFLKELREMSYTDAMDFLLSFKGIGNKVANCICLFGLHHIEAFPIDTHIKQILNKHYPQGFDMEKFKGYAGIVQQYMFYYKINQKN